MNEGVLLLKEVAKLKDIVSLGVCVSIFQTCNGKQFKNMPASDFFCFLNLKLPKEKVTILPGEKQRICYMIYVVSQTIVPLISPRRGLREYWICAVSPMNIMTNIARTWCLLTPQKTIGNLRKSSKKLWKGAPKGQIPTHNHIFPQTLQTLTATRNAIR